MATSTYTTYMYGLLGRLWKQGRVITGLALFYVFSGHTKIVQMRHSCKTTLSTIILFEKKTRTSYIDSYHIQ